MEPKIIDTNYTTYCGRSSSGEISTDAFVIGNFFLFSDGFVEFDDNIMFSQDLPIFSHGISIVFKL
jgi:hypothetical protein